MLSRKLLSDICIKEHNLVCNDDENSIIDEFSETLFNVPDKICITWKPDRTRHQTVS